MWTEIDTAMLFISLAAALCCVVPGTLLVVRRQAMFADAVSHVVLPGIVASFLIIGSRNHMPLIVGAVLAAGVLVVTTHWLQRQAKVDRGAAMAVVFTTMFALGMLLIEFGAQNIELDPHLLIFGSIEMAAFFDPGRLYLPMLMVALVNIVVLVLGWRWLRAALFDPTWTATQGMRPGWWQAGQSLLVALTCVVAFEAVGSIVVLALLVIPGLIAWLWCQRLAPLLLVSSVISVVAAALGVVLGAWLPAVAEWPQPWDGFNIAGSIGTILLVMLIAALGLKRLQHWHQSRRAYVSASTSVSPEA